MNVDETTYMFSPEVLDRANVLEFWVSSSELKEFLKNPAAVDFAKLNAAGAEYGRLLTSLAQQPARLTGDPRRKFEVELCLFCDVLKTANAEFGFRVAKEAAAFLYFHQLLSGGDWDFKAAKAAHMEDESLDPLGLAPNGLPTYPPVAAYYRPSFEKIIQRLLEPA